MIRHDSRPRAGAIDWRLYDALTDLCGYVLLLEAEQVRLGRRIEERLLAGGRPRRAAELRAGLAEECDALRATIEALREHAATRGVAVAPERARTTRARVERREPPPGSGSRPAA